MSLGKRFPAARRFRAQQLVTRDMAISAARSWVQLGYPSLAREAVKVARSAQWLALSISRAVQR